MAAESKIIEDEIPSKPYGTERSTWLNEELTQGGPLQKKVSWFRVIWTRWRTYIFIKFLQDLARQIGYLLISLSTVCRNCDSRVKSLIEVEITLSSEVLRMDERKPTRAHSIFDRTVSSPRSDWYFVSLNTTRSYCCFVTASEWAFLS